MRYSGEFARNAERARRTSCRDPSREQSEGGLTGGGAGSWRPLQGWTKGGFDTELNLNCIQMKARPCCDTVEGCCDNVELNVTIIIIIIIIII